MRGGQGDVELLDGEQIFGRGRHCDICLADAQLSREHGSILVLAYAVVVTDFGSLNGVRVNGTKIDRPQELRVGDEIAVGQHVWQLQPKDDGPPTGSQASWGVGSTPTPQVSPDLDDIALAANSEEFIDPESGVVPKAERVYPPSSPRPGPASAAPDSDPRTSRQALSSGVRPVDPDEAEGQLLFLAANLLESARAGSRVDPQNCARAARLAVYLAHATHDGRWFQKIVELHTQLQRRLPIDVLDELFSIPPEAQIDIASLRAHLAVSRANSPEEDLANDYLLVRMEAVVRLLAARG